MVLQYFNVDCMWGDCIVGFVHVKIYKGGDYMTGQILLITVLTTSLHVVFYLWVFNIFQAHPERWNAFISFCTMDGARLTLENRNKCKEDPRSYFRLSFRNCISCVNNCEDLLYIYFFIPQFKYMNFIYS